MGLGASLRKIVVKVNDIMEFAKRFRAEPRAAMQEVLAQVREGVTETLERVMDAEIHLVLGEHKESGNTRNGYTKHSFAIKGVGEVAVKVPRDRKGSFESRSCPPSRRYDEAIEHDITLLYRAALSTQTFALVSKSVLTRIVHWRWHDRSVHDHHGRLAHSIAQLRRTPIGSSLRLA